MFASRKTVVFGVITTLSLATHGNKAAIQQTTNVKEIPGHLLYIAHFIYYAMLYCVT